MRWNKNCRIGRNYKSSSLADNVRNVAYEQLNKKFGGDWKQILCTRCLIEIQYV